MQVVEVKQVDLWDGGDRTNFGFYLNKGVSDSEIKAAYMHCVISPRTLAVFDNLKEVADNSQAKLRRAAWNKLSPMERLALGLLEPPACVG